MFKIFLREVSLGQKFILVNIRLGLKSTLEFKKEDDYVQKKTKKYSPVIKNPINIHLYSDSQGINVQQKVAEISQFKISSFVKPGAKFKDVVSSHVDNLGKDDILVVLAGSNDVATNEVVDLLQSLKKTLVLPTEELQNKFSVDKFNENNSLLNLLLIC